MHGLIHVQLELYAVGALGREPWERAAERAGTPGKVYDPGQRYDDAELVTMVMALSRESGKGPQALLEGFGEAIVPSLVEAYGHLIDPAWRTIDLVEHTEAVIHTALRRDDPLAQPPLLKASRRGPDEVVVIYASERRMCGLAKGIVRGVGKAFGERVEITDESCMLSGDPTCDLAVRVV